MDRAGAHRGGAGQGGANRGGAGRGGARAGPRGLEREAIVAAALALWDAGGEAGFSIRKLGARLGCDPMAVLYHFGTRDGLERAMADRLAAEIATPDPTLAWDARLRAVAAAYRDLALRRPAAYPLLQRFWVAGPADFAQGEAIYAALAEAGVDDDLAVDLGFGFLALVLGLAAAEIGGFLRPPDEALLAEAAALPEATFPETRRLIPAFRRQEPGRTFREMVDLTIEAIALRGRTVPAAPPG